MDKKIIIIAIIIAVILILGIPAYESYQNQMLSENFNKSIQNAMEDRPLCGSQQGEPSPMRIPNAGIYGSL